MRGSGKAARERTGTARRVWRGVAVAGAAVGCLLLGGCIYLRLLELKNQLASFDRYFDVDLRDGVKITCRKPVLLDEDMAFFQLAPESRERVGVAERWHFRWIKAYAAPGENPANYEVTADFIYVDHKLTRILLPERLFVFVPKHFLLEMLKAFGHANVDKVHRTANATVHVDLTPEQAPPLLAPADLRAMVGAPMEVRATPGGEVWRYRYRGASPDQRSGHIDVAFTFDAATKTVRHIEGVVFNSRFVFDFAGPAAQPAEPQPPPAHAPAP